PTLTVYDANGAALATNDNWEDAVYASEVSNDGLAPTDPLESALILHLQAGVYTAIVSGVDGGTGLGLVEVYDL
ncbi:MAG: hypothetical protein M3429_08535, partial [Verrucomicrobiota bacterium]|nr:hypothetical protein [Verrucomicrobiota bacterium]